jgi:hypothetical protein
MGSRLRIGADRTVRATLDTADEGEEADTVVVACPPHPQHGGDRSDTRIRTVSEAICDRGIDCLRIDYGPWDGGRGEVVDVRRALGWERRDYGRVGLFGYSFGGAVALLAAADAFEAETDTPDAVSVLAPASTVGDGADAAGAVGAVECPLQVVYGSRDDTVDSGPVVARAREHGAAVEALAADHFYVGKRETAARLVAAFLVEHLDESRY